MATAIQVENLSKQYRLGQIGTGSITHDVNRWWHTVRGKEDPYLKIGETNDRTKTGTSEYVWSLKDINFKINQGDAIGIIGRNGAGKSTLLKILSRVTSPTTGNVKAKGRIASLLEVGTGFHPELSGRENIFLNGAILGMRKYEITKKFDEIVDFAGVERYIDTPVKRYSSGMYVRLAFAVAAYLESEILIVDEVLAVGDAEFQQKCLGKMGEVSKSEGRTVLFVSHNMDAIVKLCQTSILLKSGTLLNYSDTNLIVQQYLNENNTLIAFDKNVSIDKPKIRKVEVDAESIAAGNLKCIIQFDSPFLIERPNIGLVLKSGTGTPVFGTNFKLHPGNSTKRSIQNGIAVLEITDLPLHSGRYAVDIYLSEEDDSLDMKIDYLTFEFISRLSANLTYDIKQIGPLNVKANWSLTNSI